MSSNGNIFRVIGPLCGEFTGQRWISRTKASDADLWYFFFDLCLNKWWSKQSWGRWFETQSSPLWRHCNNKSCHDQLCRNSHWPPIRKRYHENLRALVKTHHYSAVAIYRRHFYLYNSWKTHHMSPLRVRARCWVSSMSENVIEGLSLLLFCYVHYRIIYNRDISIIYIISTVISFYTL